MNTTNQYQYETIARWNREAEKFKENGGNIMLFWAGRMALASRSVTESTLGELSDNISWLRRVTDIYDDVMFSDMNKK